MRGHRILPVPTFRSEPSVGLSFGVRGRYVYRPPGETFDHARVDLSGRVSTNKVQDHTLDVQLRDLLHRQEILDLNLRFLDDPVFPYLGVASFEPLRLDELSAPEHKVHLRSMSAAFDYQHPFAVLERGQWGIETTGYARWLLGARFAHDQIRSAPDTLWTDEGNPTDLTLRRGSIFGGLAWDSRDNGWSPKRGALHDVSIELGGPWVASTRYWARFNGSARFYRPIATPKVVLANQFIADAILGDETAGVNFFAVVIADDAPLVGAGVARPGELAWAVIVAVGGAVLGGRIAFLGREPGAKLALEPADVTRGDQLVAGTDA